MYRSLVSLSELQYLCLESEFKAVEPNSGRGVQSADHAVVQPVEQVLLPVRDEHQAESASADEIVEDTGVGNKEMQAIGGGEFSTFDDAEFVLLQYARAVESGTVTDKIHHALMRHSLPAEIVGLGLLVDSTLGCVTTLRPSLSGSREASLLAWSLTRS